MTVRRPGFPQGTGARLFASAPVALVGFHFFSFSAAFSIASMWPSGFMLA